MRSFITLPLVVALWMGFSRVALGALSSEDVPKLIPPSQDPWYSAPAGFDSYPPGAILRVRQAPSNVSSLLNNTSGAYQILYRSTDTRYRPSWAVTTIFFPTKTSRTDRGTRVLVSYQIPYNTINVDESPSYGLSTLYGEDYMANVRKGLSRGWAMSVPDFEGPLASFTAGPQAGHAVLDSIRAILSFNKFEGPGEIRYALWGYSGGALASNSAAELQASYAPDLDFAGIAIGGVPSNFTQICYNVTGSPAAAIVPQALLGVTSQYPEARDYLVSKLYKEGPYNATVFLAAQNMTNNENALTFAGQNIFDYFTNGEGIFGAPEMVRVLGNNWHMGYHGIPQMPVFAYKAIADELTSITYTDDHIDRLCRVGANVLYQRNTVGMHEAEYFAVSPKALEWLGQVLDGIQPEPTVGCKIENVTVTVSA
ncbi:lipase 5 [Xylariaceae sp. FL1651]|nr:lipase 5 [Xylariaceae sp. FL1651]